MQEPKEETGSAGGRWGEEGTKWDSSLVPVLKWPQARSGTDGLFFLMLSWRSGEREKEKINTVTVRNLK